MNCMQIRNSFRSIYGFPLSFVVVVRSWKLVYNFVCDEAFACECLYFCMCILFVIHNDMPGTYGLKRTVFCFILSFTEIDLISIVYFSVLVALNCFIHHYKHTLVIGLAFTLHTLKIYEHRKIRTKIRLFELMMPESTYICEISTVFLMILGKFDSLDSRSSLCMHTCVL